MSDGSHDLLVRGIAALRAREPEEARRYLEWVLRVDATPEERVDALYGLSEIAADPAEQRGYLEQILSDQPFNPRARRKLAILDGRLDPADVIDPDRLIQPSIQPPIDPNDVQRFACPRCGGRLTYAPDGLSLVCESCESGQRLAAPRPPEPTSQPGKDYLLALATARGHLSAQTTRAFTCGSCGASFLLPPPGR